MSIRSKVLLPFENSIFVAFWFVLIFEILAFLVLLGKKDFEDWGKFVVLHIVEFDDIIGKVPLLVGQFFKHIYENWHILV